MALDRLAARRRCNALQSLLLLAAMAGVAGYLGWTVLGLEGAVWAIIGLTLLVAASRGLSTHFALRLVGGAEIPAWEAPALHRLLEGLAARARLRRVPRLYCVPTGVLNALTVGRRNDATIIVTAGLLRALEPRELAGVLAHEVAHVRANDVSVMSLADVVARMTRLLATFGALLLALLLPVAAASNLELELLPIVVMILAPVLSSLLQLALSRTREFEADLGAVELTGDPRGLASALDKLERLQGGWMERVLSTQAPKLLQTHPDVRERIRRLHALEAVLGSEPGL